MTARQARLDADGLTAALSGTPPATLDREGRVRLLAEAARAALEGRPIAPEALLFVFGGLAAWLEEGGDLCREYWKVTGPAGSHRTPTWLLRNASSGGRQDGDDGATMPRSPE